MPNLETAKLNNRNIRVLVIRLSSLGDVVLSSSYLNSQNISKINPVDWLVSAEYAELLEGHPNIGRIWKFARKSGDRRSILVGLKEWITLCQTIWNEDYDEIHDLHGSLRTRVAQLIFHFLSFTSPRQKKSPPHWKRVSKQRVRLYGFFIFKGLWPARLRPDSWVQRYSQMSGINKQSETNLSHLMTSKNRGVVVDLSSIPKPYICVMPDSLGIGKKWPTSMFLETLKTSNKFYPVIMGSEGDTCSHDLVKAMESAGLPHLSGVGKWSLREVAQVLHGAVCYFGNDTGLAHLAEAMGTPALVIYGPTHPQMGFGPWKPQSKMITSDLGCQPCGKDGRFCYRRKEKYLCLTSLNGAKVGEVLSDFEERISKELASKKS